MSQLYICPADYTLNQTLNPKPKLFFLGLVLGFGLVCNFAGQKYRWLIFRRYRS